MGMCSPPRDENYILSCSKPLRSELEIASKHHSLKMVTKGLSLWKSLCPTSDGNKTSKGYKYTHLVVGFWAPRSPPILWKGEDPGHAWFTTHTRAPQPLSPGPGLASQLA